MFTPNKNIHSNQPGIHYNLGMVLEKHKNNAYLKPAAQHTVLAFERVKEYVSNTHLPVILDSGCGVGESSVYIANKYKDHIVIAVDKSLHRLAKNAHYNKSKPSNLVLVQADLIDFWRLALKAKWNIVKHFILYPNPWPLKKDLKKRFHAHPVFEDMISLCPNIEVRSNWKTYLEEFAFAYYFFSGQKPIIQEFFPVEIFTPFERKFVKSGHCLYILNTE